jgi:hypothetical protein
MVSLAWGFLSQDDWARGYANLVRLYGNAGRVGRLTGESQALVEHGAAGLTLSLDSPRRPGPRWNHQEGAAIVSTARDPWLAWNFLQFATREHADRPDSELVAVDPALGWLVADLLGSTLVDAHEALAAAWSAVVEADRPAVWEERLTALPPWPPGSVLKLRDRSDGEALIDILAEQVAPDAEARAWLLASWETPGDLDGDRLRALARAADGRLASEPRLRSWLRGEWTAWARQRYRWIARHAREVEP